MLKLDWEVVEANQAANQPNQTKGREIGSKADGAKLSSPHMMGNLLVIKIYLYLRSNSTLPASQSVFFLLCGNYYC